MGAWLAPAVFSQAAPQQAPSSTPLERVEFNIPFDRWIAQGKHQSIPWKFWVSPVDLSYDQRLEFSVEVEIDSRKLTKLGERHDLYLITRIGDERGHWIEQAWLGMRVSRPPPKRSVLTFRQRFFVLPGRYRVAVVLYDHDTGLYSARAQWIQGQPVKNDPLPNAFSSLPRVQALAPIGQQEPRFLPGIYSRLALPVQTERPIHFEVILSYPFTNFGFPLTALNVFSQMRPKQYTYHITVVDPSTRSVVLEQNNVREADWLALRNTIRKANPGVISAEALEGSRQNLVYLRDLLAQRLAEPLPDVAGRQPLKVLLVLGAPRFLLPRDAERVELAPELLGEALFFQVRTPLPSFFAVRFSPILQSIVSSHLAFDGVLKDILSRENAKRFEVATPMEFRRALAEIISLMEQRGKSGSVAGSPRLPL